MRCFTLVLATGLVACSSFGKSDDPPGGADSDASVPEGGGPAAVMEGGAPDAAVAAVVGCAAGSPSCTGGSFCCIHGRNSEPIECVAPKGSCPDAFGARAYCDDTTDCPSGNVCCLHFAGIFGDLASCVTSSACAADDSHNRMCDPSNPGECGAGSCVSLRDARPTYAWRLPAFVCKP